MPRQKAETPAARPSTLAEELAALTGKQSGVDVYAVNPTLLWYAITGMVNRGVGVQVSLTKDRSSWSVQAWDGTYPVKDYLPDTDALNRHFAAWTRLTWKKELPDDVEALVREYGY